VTQQARAGAIDRVGQALSVACAVHCALVPLILGLLPLAAARATEAVHHLVLAPFILATSLVAFVPGYRRHRSFLPGILGAVGCLVLLRALTSQSEAREALLTFAASALLVVAHARNRALWHRSCAH
jgi:hypothetical protein